MKEVTGFAWGNYFRASPRNLQYLTEGLKTIIGTVGVSTYFSGNEKFAFWTMVTGAILDQAARFFGRVEHDREQELDIHIEGDNLKVTTNEGEKETPTS
jgi:hypothetical protein